MIERKMEAEKKAFSYETLVDDYFTYGSPEKALSARNFSQPISVAEYHRVIKRWGIIKNATSRQSSLGDILLFFSKMVQEKRPLESVYRRFFKNNTKFKTSVATLHRVFNAVKIGLTQKEATALVISPQDNLDYVLIGRDISTPRLEIGKPYGSVTMPATFSTPREQKEESILRVLQQEVLKDLAVKGKLRLDDGGRLPYRISDRNKHFLTLKIADVKVNVYYLALSEELCQNLSSSKIVDFKFVHINELLKNNQETNLREGVYETASAYLEYLHLRSSNKIIEREADINLKLRDPRFLKLIKRDIISDLGFV